jgi:hypothetical protein
VNHIVRLPTFPQTSLMSEVGLAGSAPGYRFMEQNNALAAFQNTLIPPPAPLPITPAVVSRGRAVFAQAGCPQCHAGSDLTNHRIISVSELGMDPSRAAALKTTEAHYVPPALYAFDTPVPIPPKARPVAVPTAQIDPQQIQLAFAYGGTPGRYKVPSLIGVYWSAPYLHDGGVAVGTHAQTQCGVPGTLLQSHGSQAWPCTPRTFQVPYVTAYADIPISGETEVGGHRYTPGPVQCMQRRCVRGALGSTLRLCPLPLTWLRHRGRAPVHHSAIRPSPRC